MLDLPASTHLPEVPAQIVAVKQLAGSTWYNHQNWTVAVFYEGGAMARLCLILLILLGALCPAAGGAAPAGIIENCGQYDPRVRFCAPCDQAILFFTDDAIVMDFPAEHHAVWVWIDGARRASQPEPRQTRDSYLNRFRGTDPSRWQVNIPIHDALVYRNVKPGFDLHLIPCADRLCYELKNQAGETSAACSFRFEGLDDAPVCLATTAGEGGAHELRWAVAGADIPGEVSRDDLSTVTWSTMLGGGDQDYSHSVAVDGSGQVLVGGYTRSNNFPVSAGSYDTSHNGDYDGYVAKLTADGENLIWATLLGGELEDRIFIVVPDANNDLFLAGQTYSADFPTTEGAYDRVMGAPRDGYIAKLTEAGNTLVWSTYLGGSGKDRVWVLELDEAGRPVVVGETNSPDYPTTLGAYDTVYEGLSDGYVTKLDAQGRNLVWSTLIGGSLEDKVMWFALDHTQSPVVCGSTTSADFPTSPAAFDTSYNGGEEGFVARLDSLGQTLVAGTYLGGSSNDIAYALALDWDDEVVVTGTTQSADFPVESGSYDTTLGGWTDAFVTRLEPSLSSLVFGTFLGGTANDEAYTLVLDQYGCPVISGETASDGFPTTGNAYDRTYNGGIDAFVTRLNHTGTGLLWSSFFGGSDLDGGWELTLDAAGSPLLTGPTRSGNMPTTGGAYDETPNGGKDAFVTRFDIVEPAAADEGEFAPALRPALWAGPNPTSGIVHVRLQLEQPRPLPVELSALDATGRRIATLHRGHLGAGLHRFEWDGRDDDGRPVAAGVYWLTLLAPNLHTEERIMLVR